MSDEEEEDWFERAMREAEGESEESSDSPDADETATSADESADAETEPTEGTVEEPIEEPIAEEPIEEESDPFGGAHGGPRPGSDDEPEPEPESDPFGGISGGDAETDDPFGDDEGFPGRGSGRDTIGGGGFDDEGFGGFGEEGEGFGEAPESFDEAELDSDIDRVDIGIEGLDEMILGGVPKRSLMVSIGSAGTGKTTVALQFLTEALENDERGIYITLEESREAILSTAEEKGWPFRKWRDQGQLAIVAMDPIEMANSLSSIRNDISRLVEEFNADRLVLDSVSLLEMMYDHPAERRSEVFDFARSLKRAGVTTMLTSEATSDDPYTSRYGIIEYLVDAVFILQYVRPSDFRETRLAVEIQKIRDANHSRETKPYEITNEGISVYRQANIF